MSRQTKILIIGGVAAGMTQLFLHPEMEQK